MAWRPRSASLRPGNREERFEAMRPAVKHHVLDLVTRLELGGAQQIALFCVAHHDRSRFDVDLVAGRGGLLDDEALRIPDTNVRLVAFVRHPVSPLHDLAAVPRLAAWFRRRRIDVVHTHCSKAGILGRWAAWLARVPVVVHTVHGWSFNETQPALVRRMFVALERWTARVTSRLVVVSEGDRRTGLALGIGRPEQYVLLRAGIVPGEYERPARPREEVRAALGFEPGAVVVGTLACLKAQKAPLDFVEVARLAHARDPALRFFIAGDGPLRPQVEARIAAAGLDGVVKLLGWRHDVVDLLHAMDVFLLVSRFEGLPRAVVQAMAAGVPVVATAVGGTPEVVIDNRTGVLIPPARPGIAAERLLALVADAPARRRYAECARERLGAEFDLRAVVHDLESLYLTLLAFEPAGALGEANADGRR